MTYKAVLFDLDGTLLDTLDDLADSMNAVLLQLGCPAHPVSRYKYFVGDGVQSLASRVLPAEHQNQESINQCAEMMITEYGERWSKKTKLYPGIAKMLTELQKRGVSLNILSNKPDALTQKAVNHYLLNWKFSHIHGARPNIAKKPDPSAAVDIARKCSFSPADFLYLGDTNTDMQTAVSAGMKPVGVLWGFRTKEELSGAGAEILLETPADLFQYV